MRALRLFTVLTLMLFAASLTFSGCAPRRIVPPRTQLQLREFQTRSYEITDTLRAVRAVISALLDDGFIVRNADKELGLVTASKEIDIEDPNERFWATLLAGDSGVMFQKSSQVECSVQVVTSPRETRVRAVFLFRVLDNLGNPIKIEQVDDPGYYRDFFARVDKSIFLEKSNL